KSQVPHTLKTFCNLIQNQFSKTIEVLRLDNGSEFLNLDCETLCDDLGIVHQTSCTYTPQQNGRVERKHRHLLNVAHALLFYASLPIKFWGDSILTANFLINRTTTQLLGWKTPYEILYGHPPAYNHLRVFRSLFYATNLSPQKTKFHRRALKCIMIGYGMHQKAHKLFDLDSNVVFFSRNVYFYEHIVPFSHSVNESAPTPLLLVPIRSEIDSFPIVDINQPVPDFVSSSVPTPHTQSPSTTSVIPSLPTQTQIPPPLRRSLRKIQKPT
ncbi:UNVERIFIED_CONTAM: hypothetical protein Sradi_5295700, partial [Sesamum radiatum]